MGWDGAESAAIGGRFAIIRGAKTPPEPIPHIRKPEYTKAAFGSKGGRSFMPRRVSQLMSGRGIKPLPPPSQQRLKFQPDVGRLCVLRGGDPMKFADIAAALPTNAVTSFDGLPFPKIAS